MIYLALIFSVFFPSISNFLLLTYLPPSVMTRSQHGDSSGSDTHTHTHTHTLHTGHSIAIGFKQSVHECVTATFCSASE